jgi:GxxExxY protein
MNRIISKESAGCAESKKEILHNSVNSVSKPEYDLAGQVIGLAMKVHRTLGPGFLESVYQKALLYELAKAGLKVESDQPIQVRYEGVIVGDFKADLIVNDELIVELKAVSGLAVEHEVQLVNYLTATGKDIGLLLNFGGRSLEFKKNFRTAKIEDISLH